MSRVLASLSAGERRTLGAMVSVVAGLHVLGFVALLVVVTPGHYHLAKTGALTIGIGVTAYTLGLRHAFDADTSPRSTTLHASSWPKASGR